MALFPTVRRPAAFFSFRTFLYISFIAFPILLIGLFLSNENARRIIPPSIQNLIPSLTGEPRESALFRQWQAFPNTDVHPINDLIGKARAAHLITLNTRSHDVKGAADNYRRRRNRHPPPGFEQWVEYAVKHDALIIESYFDRIYHDLQPFWAVDAKVVAESAANWDHVVQVREGKATPQGDTTGRVPWLQLWTALVAECAEHLPDVDMPINYMDESRLLVPWTEIDRLVKIAQEKQKITPVQETIQKYSGGVTRQNLSTLGPEGHRPTWIRNIKTPMWDHVAACCSPDSPGHGVPALADFTGAPEFPTQDQEAAYAQQGYVKNVSAATDPCQQPHLRGLHGTLIEPVTISVSKDMFPLFGGSKMPTNNEILIPGAMYLTDDPFYSGSAYRGPEWPDKTSTITWRGVASGGRHMPSNWRHFQRHRMIEMLNGTTVSNIQLHNGSAMTFQMPPANLYPSALTEPGHMGKWLSENADAGFVELLCWPPESHCDYLSPHYHEVESKKMSDQYGSKFFADADGNSFSARYRALLLSTSVPLKATIYAAWDDDRLQPWLHYIPMDNTFQDMYGLLDYFTRDAKGDAAAHLIAETGKIWAEKTLRREDMLLYVWRLLLEFARICDKNRDKLGYVADLVDSSGKP